MREGFRKKDGEDRRSGFINKEVREGKVSGFSNKVWSIMVSTEMSTRETK